MKNYKRTQEKINSSKEINQSINFLEEMLYHEYFYCTEYQIAVQNDDLDNAGDWYALWQDAITVLHKI